MNNKTNCSNDSKHWWNSPKEFLLREYICINSNNQVYRSSDNKLYIKDIKGTLRHASLEIYAIYD